MGFPLFFGWSLLRHGHFRFVVSTQILHRRQERSRCCYSIVSVLFVLARVSMGTCLNGENKVKALAQSLHGGGDVRVVLNRFWCAVATHGTTLFLCIFFWVVGSRAVWLACFVYQPKDRSSLARLNTWILSNTMCQMQGGWRRGWVSVRVRKGSCDHFY